MFQPTPERHHSLSAFVKVHEIKGKSLDQIAEELFERYVAAPARSELEVMRQLEEAELDAVAV